MRKQGFNSERRETRDKNQDKRQENKENFVNLCFLVNLCEINKRQDNNDTDYTDLQGL